MTCTDLESLNFCRSSFLGLGRLQMNNPSVSANFNALPPGFHLHLPEAASRPCRRFAHLASPLGARSPGHIRRLLQPINRLRYILILEFPENRLRLGITHIHMAVVKQKNFMNGRGD